MAINEHKEGVNGIGASMVAQEGLKIPEEAVVAIDPAAAAAVEKSLVEAKGQLEAVLDPATPNLVTLADLEAQVPDVKRVVPESVIREELRMSRKELLFLLITAIIEPQKLRDIKITEELYNSDGTLVVLRLTAKEGKGEEVWLEYMIAGNHGSNRSTTTLIDKISVENGEPYYGETALELRSGKWTRV